MRDCAGEIFVFIPDKLIQHLPREGPGRLPRQAAAIAGNAKNIEVLQAGDDAIGKKVIIQPDIIMDEDQNLRGVRGIQDPVLNTRQASAIFKGNTPTNTLVKCKALQGSAKRCLGQESIM